MLTRKKSIVTVVVSILLAMCITLSGCNYINEVIDGFQSIELTDDSGVAVTGKFEEGSSLVVEQVTGTKKQEAVALIDGEEYYRDGGVLVYDISVVKDNAEVHPTGKVKVTVPATGLDSSKTYKVFHVKDDGTVESLSAKISSGKLEFETSSFSYFIVTEVDTRAVVQVSINILPYAAYGTLKVNGELLTAAASYKTTHYEGDTITVEAVAAEGHHFIHWLSEDDTVLSEQSEYRFTVAKSAISFGAIFSDWHVVEYTDINEDTHTESCKYCDYSETVAHEFVNEEIISEATCKQTGEKKLTCVCGEVKYETIPMTDHNYVDGTCTVCGKGQLYTRCQSNGVADPKGAYVKFGTHYSDLVESEEQCAQLLEQAGDPTLDLTNWTAYPAESGMGNMYYCDVQGEAINCRGVYIADYRENNYCYFRSSASQTEQGRNGYFKGGIYWFYERELLWHIDNYKDGIATLRTPYVYESQPFHNVDEEVTYEDSYIRSWLLSQLDEIFTAEQQEILLANDDCYGDKIYLPGEEELTPVTNHSKRVYGYYDYTMCMGIFYDTNNNVYNSPYWLRDGIVKTEDGNNYAKCITSRLPFDVTTSHIVTQTWVGVVPTVRIEMTL
ncbi:MAG: hypothetical protein ACI4QI_06800 [Candidatus Coproplasma sp.]